MLKNIKINLPVQLLFILLFCLFFGHFVNGEVKSLFLAISVSIKEALIFVLPFIIFSFLFSCILSFQGGALKFIVSVLGLVCFSNFISTMFAYVVGTTALSNVNIITSIMATAQPLEPMWSLGIPKFISNDIALFAGLLLGMYFSYVPNDAATKFAAEIRRYANYILNKLFLPVVPLFIFGFILKLQHDGVLAKVIVEYGPIFAIIFSAQVVYVLFLLSVASDFRVREVARYIKNFIPAVITGFSTMSSAAALPLVIKSAEQNIHNPDLAKVVVPTSINIHLIGCSLFIPIISMAIMQTYGLALPDFGIYLIFAGYFVVAKFAVAAVPGGGIIVMIPVLEQFLGFTPEMLSLITALYIMFDSFITSINIAGNSFFPIMYNKVFGKKLVNSC
jgi:Na+/H+-dicarboxylate symporter